MEGEKEMKQKETFIDTNPQEKHYHASVAIVFSELMLGMLLVTGFIFGTASLLNKTLGYSHPSVQAAEVKHVYFNLSILINRPGMHKDWPGYSNTRLVAPANSIVTMTIHNYDLGDTPLPGGSPFGQIQGTVGNTAFADGSKYSSLALDKIAHTFTIPQLGINVPIPGDAPKGTNFSSVTFTFRTSNAGTYTFRCFDPCGTGSSGWMGPMLTKGYMVGTLTVL
jgi:hypothetical protein